MKEAREAFRRFWPLTRGDRKWLAVIIGDHRVRRRVGALRDRRDPAVRGPHRQRPEGRFAVRLLGPGRRLARRRRTGRARRLLRQLPRHLDRGEIRPAPARERLPPCPGPPTPLLPEAPPGRPRRTPHRRRRGHRADGRVRGRGHHLRGFLRRVLRLRRPVPPLGPGPRDLRPGPSLPPRRPPFLRPHQAGLAGRAGGATARSPRSSRSPSATSCSPRPTTAAATRRNASTWRPAHG